MTGFRLLEKLVVSIFCIMLAPFLRLCFRFSRPVIRLWRLISVRARCRGRVPVSTQFDGALRIIGTGSVILGDSCRLGAGMLFETVGAGEVRIGNNVRINTGSVIVSACHVSIGDHTLIGEYVSIRDANHGTSIGKLIRLQAQVGDAISIGKDVWIGRGACILKGVTIKDGAVIGANSVVTGNVPENAIFAGVPATLIGKRK